jgi:hypothetical protein
MTARPFGVAFLPSPSKDASLIIFDRNYELHRFGKENNAQPKQTLPKIEQSLFASVYGNSNKKEAFKLANVEKVDPKSLEFLDIPAHVLPVPSKLANKFLSGFLYTRPALDSSETVVEENPSIPDTDFKLNKEPKPILKLDYLNEWIAGLVFSDATFEDEKAHAAITYEVPKNSNRMEKKDQKSTPNEKKGAKKITPSTLYKEPNKPSAEANNGTNSKKTLRKNLEKDQFQIHKINH